MAIRQMRKLKHDNDRRFAADMARREAKRQKKEAVSESAKTRAATVVNAAAKEGR